MWLTHIDLFGQLGRHRIAERTGSYSFSPDDLPAGVSILTFNVNAFSARALEHGATPDPAALKVLEGVLASRAAIVLLQETHPVRVCFVQT